MSPGLSLLLDEAEAQTKCPARAAQLNLNHISLCRGRSGRYRRLRAHILHQPNITDSCRYCRITVVSVRLCSTSAGFVCAGGATGVSDKRSSSAKTVREFQDYGRRQTSNTLEAPRKRRLSRVKARAKRHCYRTISTRRCHCQSAEVCDAVNRELRDPADRRSNNRKRRAFEQNYDDLWMG